AGHLRLQRHAADRAASGADLADLRMHRAGVDRALRHLGFRLGLVEILPGIGSEFGSAARRAEMKGLAAIVEPMPACRGVARHSADGVAQLGVAVSTMLTIGGIVTAAAAPGLHGFLGL